MKWLKKIPYWQLIAIPFLLMFLGIASNQAVLIANHDTFPVMMNQEHIMQACTPVTDVSLAAAIAKIMHEQPYDPNACENGGAYLDDSHVIMTSKTHLNYLADIFDLKTSIYSIGDFFIMLGEWTWDWSIVAWIVLILRRFLEA